MAHIDITLYANGALRLTRHGRGRGGNVLMHAPTGEQCDVNDSHADTIDTILSDPDSSSARSPENAREYFEHVRDWLRHLP